MSANGMVRPCSCPASGKLARGAQTRSTQCPQRQHRMRSSRDQTRVAGPSPYPSGTYEAGEFVFARDHPRPVQHGGIGCRRAVFVRARVVALVRQNKAGLHRVTICRELRHSDEIIKSEHGGTDPWQKERLGGVLALCARPSPACPAWGEDRNAADTPCGEAATVKRCAAIGNKKGRLGRALSMSAALAISSPSSRKITPCHRLPRTSCLTMLMKYFIHS